MKEHENYTNDDNVAANFDGDDDDIYCNKKNDDGNGVAADFNDGDDDDDNDKKNKYDVDNRNHNGDDDDSDRNIDTNHTSLFAFS